MGGSTDSTSGSDVAGNSAATAASGASASSVGVQASGIQNTSRGLNIQTAAEKQGNSTPHFWALLLMGGLLLAGLAFFAGMRRTRRS